MVMAMTMTMMMMMMVVVMVMMMMVMMMLGRMPTILLVLVVGGVLKSGAGGLYSL